MAHRCDFTFDDRERDLFEQFRLTVADIFNDCVGRVQSKRLALGDVLIEATDTTGQFPSVLVERKRVDDLMASVFDGRLVEQERRLKDVAERDNTNTIIIVEGIADETWFKRCKYPDSRYRHFLKTYVTLCGNRQGPLVLRSRGLRETSLLLLTLHRTLISCAAPHVSRQSLPVRRRPNPFVHQLCGTVGMSERRALAVTHHFSTVVDLLNAWHQTRTKTEQKLQDAIGNRPLVHRLLNDLGLHSSSDNGRNRPNNRNQPVSDEKRQQQFDERRLKRARFHINKEHADTRHDNHQRQRLAIDAPPAFVDLRVVDGDRPVRHEDVVDMQQDQDDSQCDGQANDGGGVVFTGLGLTTTTQSET